MHRAVNNEYIDVTNLFTKGVEGMGSEEVILTDGYTLNDAMTAFEIGEPRLDSGMLGDREYEKKFPFEPLQPLLPEELCWIIDRSMQYEMEWHSGNILSHTVFTLRYAHCLEALDPDTIPTSHPLVQGKDLERPHELVTVVLRAAVAGLLKCCDMSWRIMNSGGIQEAEDWQSEKCDISLLEGQQPPVVLAKLDKAMTWLSWTNKLSPQWRHALLARLSLRRAMLQLLITPIPAQNSQALDFIKKVRGNITSILAHPATAPTPGSPASRVFDPYISRRFPTFIPIRVIEVPPMEQTFQMIRRMLDGFEEMTRLSATSEVWNWEATGNHRQWFPDGSPQLPVVRAGTQAIFFDGVYLLRRYNSMWLVERFFFESLGARYLILRYAIEQLWDSTSPVDQVLAQLEKSVSETLRENVRSLWFNLPRRRRYLMRAVENWHALYDFVVRLLNDLDTENLHPNDIIHQLPSAVLLYEMTTVREILLSGMQLELYNLWEKVFVYWYLAKVLGKHLECLDSLLSVIPEDSEAHKTYEHLSFQRSFLGALHAMSLGMFRLLTVNNRMSVVTCWSKIRHNFARRFKWAFGSVFENVDEEFPVTPDLYDFVRMQYDKDVSDSAASRFALGSEILAACETGDDTWSSERRHLIDSLKKACEDLRKGSQSDAGVISLRWDVVWHPWFPCCS